MALEIEGNIKKIEPIQSGESARGVWKKRVLVISTGEQFVRDIAFIAWNDIAEALDELRRGQKVKIQFTLESREFNGKWYTDAKIWKIKVIKEEELERKDGGKTPPPAQEPDIVQDLLDDDDIDTTAEDDDLFEKDQEDDLPF